MSEHPDKQKWEELAAKELRGKPLESLDWTTPEGIQVKPLYTAEDLEGIEFANLPRSGLFHVHCYLGTRGPFVNPEACIRGLRAVAQLEKVGPHGAIDVTCTNSSHFDVDVDGRTGRRGSGLIGLLSP